MTDMTFNDRSTPFSLLATRRSGKPRDLIAPGPDAAELAQMLAIAARTPDHGKLAPWRFVIVPTAARARLAEVITTAYRAERPQAGATEIAALEQFAHQAPIWSWSCRDPAPKAIFRSGNRNCRRARRA